MELHLAILILAAGKSSRMNAIKQLLKIGSKTLLENVIDTALKINNAHIYCVLGAHQSEISNHINYYTQIEILINSNYAKGISTSIVTAIKHIKNKHKACLFLLADQPQIDTIFLNKMITTHQKNLDKIIATKYQENIGVPAIFTSKQYPFLEKLNGDEGAKSIIKNQLENTILIDFKKPFIDLDTPEDVNKYLKSI